MWANGLREEETKTTYIVLGLAFQYLTPTPNPKLRGSLFLMNGNLCLVNFGVTLRGFRAKNL